MFLNVVFTPICGSFKESYDRKKIFKNVETMLEYLLEYLNSTLNVKATKSQIFIEWYGILEDLKRDRFIVIFKDYKKVRAERYPIGFFHYEILH